MDFEVHYTDAQNSFRTEVASWLEANVPDDVRGREHEEPDETYQRRRQLGRKLGAKGWLYPMAPAQYGGGGLDIDSAMVIIDEMQRYELGLPPYYDSGGSLGSVAILVWGNDEQKQAFLPPIYSGEQRTWQLLTEPGAGSDVASVSTTAVRDGDEYVITGQKIFIGSAHGADAMWALVRTGPADARHQNLSWFMIPGDAPGVTCTPLELMGSNDKNLIFLDGVRVPAFNLVGGENKGWDVASTHLDLEHGLRTDHLIGHGIGQMWESLLAAWRAHVEELDIEDADERTADLLVQAYVNKEVVRLLGIRNFWLAMANQKRSYEGPQAYLLEKRASLRFSRLALEIFGPLALAGDGNGATAALAHSHAGGISAMHGGGTSEMQKLVIARRMGLGRVKQEEAGRLA
jgi:alkylation response protein AidB-like acyl-CoA dehydrogenase